jgi:hypothetical protein
MNILRTILFLPLAFALAITTQLIVGFIAQMFLPDWMMFFLRGFAGAFIFLVAGFRIAPHINNLLKWTLLILAIITGLATVSKYYLDENFVGMIEGISILLVVALYVNSSPDKIAEEMK